MIRVDLLVIAIDFKNDTQISRDSAFIMVETHHNETERTYHVGQITRNRYLKETGLG